MCEGAEWWFAMPPEYRHSSGNAEMRVVHFQPSTEWRDGGPIIDRELITTVASKGVGGEGPLVWFAYVGPFHHYIDERLPGYPGDGDTQGPTLLIAAMRAYVASKLGEEVELP